MHTLRGRLLLSHVLPILIVVPLVGLGIIYLLETQLLLDGLSQDLDERAALIAEVVEQQANIWQNQDLAQDLVNSVSILVQGQVLFLEPDGDLLATTDPELLDEIGERPDLEGLADAIAGETVILIEYDVIHAEGQALVPVLDVNNQLVGIVAVTESIAGLAAEFGQLRGLVLMTVLVETLVAVLIALFLARRLAGPITAVTNAVCEIAEGQRTEPIAEEGPLEVRQLAASVNTLANRLFDLEETRRRLLANLVHELGRPLGAIRAAIHVLRQGAADDPVVRDELLVGVEDEIKRMQPLLDDLAQLHGQVLGTRELNRAPLPLSDWLSPTLLPWRAAAIEKGLSWHSDIPSDLPTLNIDQERMGQALGNLLSNAIKYTPAGGNVRISARADRFEAFLIVEDDGPGISAEERQKVFEPFFRSLKQRRFPQGLGLGLTIARDIIEAHGGTLHLEDATDTGSRFIICLPLDTAPG